MRDLLKTNAHHTSHTPKNPHEKSGYSPVDEYYCTDTTDLTHDIRAILTLVS